jgi:hypothetical protein
MTMYESGNGKVSTQLPTSPAARPGLSAASHSAAEPHFDGPAAELHHQSADRIRFFNPLKRRFRMPTNFEDRWRGTPQSL